MASNFIFNDAKSAMVQVHHLMASYPELEEDASLLSDMIEGETDLHKVLSRALSERQEAETLAKAIKDREADLYERRKRFERKSEGMKKIMQALMECAHADKITLPEATLSITKARPSVNVTDVEQLPQGFFQVERKADKKAILSAITSGEQIPGAELVIGDDGLMVRTK